MSALPSAVAQAAAATAFVPCCVPHAFVMQSLPMRLVSSVVMVLAAGALVGALPSTLAASALVTVFTPGPDVNMPGVRVVPYNCVCKLGELTAALQYWIASCAMPIWFDEEKPSSVGSDGSCCCTAR